MCLLCLFVNIYTVTLVEWFVALHKDIADRYKISCGWILQEIMNAAVSLINGWNQIVHLFMELSDLKYSQFAANLGTLYTFLLYSPLPTQLVSNVSLQ